MYKIKSPLLKKQRTRKIPVVPPQFIFIRRPHGILTDSPAVTGRPVPAYNKNFSRTTPKGIPHPDTRCLAPTGSSLGVYCECVLVFITVLFGVFISLAPKIFQVNKKKQFFITVAQAVLEVQDLQRKGGTAQDKSDFLPDNVLYIPHQCVIIYFIVQTLIDKI